VRVVPASAVTLLLPGGEEVPSPDDAASEGAADTPSSLEPQVFPEVPDAAAPGAAASEDPQPAANDEAPPDISRDTREKVESES
jgi:hypothetical protein